MIAGSSFSITLSIAAIIMALLIACAVMPRKPERLIAKRRAELEQKIKEARKQHKPREHLYREQRELTMRELRP